jgi:ferredoxin
MTYEITKDCINCNACRVQCPTNAIQVINGILFIDPNLCNDCVGYHGTPQCASVCPTNHGCIPSRITDNNLSDYWQSWFKVYNELVTKLETKENPYWHNWFAVYSEKLKCLLTEK